MTTVQRAAQIFGIVFILLAIVGFITPGGMNMGTADAGMMMGMFHINLLHNVVHLLFGLWGLAAARSWSGAKQYATVSGAIFLVLAILGFVAPDGFGLVPLGAKDVWLHIALAVPLLYFGLTAKGDAVATNAA